MSILSTIARYQPDVLAPKIRDIYVRHVDPKPCVGWLPMLHELLRKATGKQPNALIARELKAVLT